MPIEIQQQQPVALQVTARAVDTYVTPSQAATGGLAETLARSLKEINPALKKYFAPAKPSEDPAAAGVVAAEILKNPVTELKSVKDNLILAQESPYRNTLYRHARGDEARAVATAKLRADYNESGLANTDDPKAFDAWVSQRTPALLEEVGTNDPNFLDAFAVGMVKTVDDLRAENQRQVSATIKTRQLDAYANTVTADIENEYERVSTESKTSGTLVEPNYDALWAQFNATKDKLRLQQYPGGEVSDFLGQTIATLAVRRVDVGLLDAFKDRDWTDPVTGKSVPGPFRGAKGKALYEATVDKIADNANTLEGRVSRREKQEREDLEAKVFGEFLPQLVEGRDISPTQAVIVGKLFGAEGLGRFRSTVAAARSGKDYVDPRVTAGFYAELNSPKGISPDRYVNYWLPRIASDKQAVQTSSDDVRANGLGEKRRQLESLRRQNLGGYDDLADGASKAGTPGGILGDLWGEVPSDAQLVIQADYGRAFTAAKNRYAALLDSPDPIVQDQGMKALRDRMVEVRERLTTYGTAAAAAVSVNQKPPAAPSLELPGDTPVVTPQAKADARAALSNIP